jgi:hypothetical protein
LDNAEQLRRRRCGRLQLAGVHMRTTQQTTRFPVCHKYRMLKAALTVSICSCVAIEILTASRAIIPQTYVPQHTETAFQAQVKIVFVLMHISSSVRNQPGKTGNNSKPSSPMTSLEITLLRILPTFHQHTIVHLLIFLHFFQVLLVSGLDRTLQRVFLRLVQSLRRFAPLLQPVWRY